MMFKISDLVVLTAKSITPYLGGHRIAFLTLQAHFWSLLNLTLNSCGLAFAFLLSDSKLQPLSCTVMTRD